VPKHPSSGKYAIIGLGVVAGQQPDRSERMIAAEAARLAIEDAGLTTKDVFGAIDLRRSGGGGDRAGYTDAFTRVLGINNNFYFICGRGGALAGLGMAAMMLSVPGIPAGKMFAEARDRGGIFGDTSRLRATETALSRVCGCKATES
jgi:hypothetical protein